jgi:hypothetical protein
LEIIWDKEQLCLKTLPHILNGFWTKIQRSLDELNFNKKSLEILETLELDEIWSPSSLLYLIAKKNKFPIKDDQKFKFPLKIGFELILW